MKETPGGRLSAYLRAVSPPLRADGEQALRDLICDYVDALKEQGYAPERMVVQVKHMAAEAGLRVSIGRWTTAASQTADEALVDRIVAWCIQRYFA